MLADKGGRFEHLTSIGVNPELLAPFDGSHLEGELGMAIATGKIVHLRDIPEDTDFRFRTFAGTLPPKEIVTIPVVVGNKVRAVISLANIRAYSIESLEIVNQVWLGINIAYSNLTAAAETAAMARELAEKNQELEAQTEQLQSMTEELRQGSEELRQQNIELELQRRQVEEANRLKSEFLSNMSHELRTPLNSIMALSRVLLMQAEEKLSKEETDYLEIIERNGKALLSLINDILDLSKIEAGKMDLTPKMFSIRATVEMISESLEPIAHGRGLAIRQTIPADLPQIESDEVKVHRILQNVMGNAVKFTESGGVTVTARRDENNVYVEVADTGIGIAQKDLPHIFEEFRQVDGTPSRRFEGTGLGLSIARRTAEMLGGQLTAKSEPGKGSVFTMSLPISWEGVTPVYESVASLPSTEIQRERRAVLVVDDDPKVVRLISNDLSKAGYSPLTATSGKEALRLAEIHHPFAMTLDIVMPDMDGWEVLQSLKKNPQTADIPVIVVSVTDGKKTAFALGAVGYVTKPVNEDVLIAEINKIGGRERCSIMVLDDNAMDREEIGRMLMGEGFQVTVAESGPVCLEVMERSIPDILVLDLIMPHMDGFEVLHRVRSNPRTTHIPVIVVTARDLTPEDKVKLNGSVTAILEKGKTTPHLLLEEIKRLLSEIERPQLSPGTEALRGGNRVLLVEDNESAVDQVKTVLESEGYEVDVARGGQEAIEYFRHTIPDGIVLDLMMPEVDGFEVLEKIRGSQATAGIPVLILTAKDLTREDLGRLSANNIEQLIQKGDVDRDGLLSKIGLLLGKKADAAPQLEMPKPATARRPIIEGKPTILVIEDNPDNMTTIKAVLSDKCHVLEATDGEEGLRRIIEQRPNLIFLDMSLPKMDGYQVVREIRKNRDISHIPVVALTAHAMRGDREKTLGSGCDDYISKPIDPEVMMDRIAYWLGTS